MTTLDSISWPVVENTKPPSGWGFWPELCCLLLVLLSSLLYLAEQHIAAVVMDVSVVPPSTKAAESESPAAKFAVALPRQATSQLLPQLHEPMEPEAVAPSAAIDIASVATGKPRASVATGKPRASVATGKPRASVATGKPRASVATGKPRVRRYIGKGADGYGLAKLWQQRALRIADTGDYHGADRIYSQAMSLAVADQSLLQALARERSLWLRHSGRHYAARQVLRSVGLQP